MARRLCYYVVYISLALCCIVLLELHLLTKEDIKEIKNNVVPLNVHDEVPSKDDVMRYKVHTTTFIPAVFEPGRNNCVIKRFDKKSDLDDYMKQQPKQETRCSLSYMHEYFRKTRQFYGEGAWYTPTMEYLPRHCTFSNYTDSSQKLTECLHHNKNVTKILLTGDSTSRYMFESLIKVFPKNWSCTVIKSVWYTKDQIKYLLVPGVPPDMLINQYFGVDKAQLAKCIVGNNIVYLEYISMTRLVNLGISIKKVNAVPPFLDATNKLEYLLKYYFPHNGFPDLWIYRMPFRHEIWWKITVERISMDLTFIIKLLGMHLPQTTTVAFYARFTGVSFAWV